MAVQIADLSDKSDPIMIYDSECPIPILTESVLESGDTYFAVKINETEQYHFKHNDISILPINNRPIPSRSDIEHRDHPEFIDVNQFALASAHFGESIVISDDEDVVFVKEYKEKDNRQHIMTDTTNNSCTSSSSSATIRRNPVRKARNSKGVKNLEGELYEEDFDFLDQQLEDEAKSKVAYKKSMETYKRWPVNVHDRPEYNSETQKIEPLDYTLREIQKNITYSSKKLPPTTNQNRKAKKKNYFARRRHKENVREERKYPIAELTKLIMSTTEALKSFVLELKDVEKYKFLLENQEVFCTFVKNAN